MSTRRTESKASQLRKATAISARQRKAALKAWKTRRANA